MGFNSTLETGISYIYLAGLITFWLGITFLYKKEKKKYLQYFSYFWASAAAAAAADILYFHFQNNIFILLNSLLYLLEALYLLKAVHRYFKREVAELWYSLLKALIILSVLGFMLQNQLFILAPTLIYLSFAFLKSGRLFYSLSSSTVNHFTALLTLLLSLYFLTAPYLMRFEWFNSYGIFIRALLGLLFGITIFGVYYEELQQELKIREKQYQKLFDQSPAGMLLIDKNAEIIKVNSAITEYTGYKKEELEGQSIFKNLVPNKFKIRARESIKGILNGEDKEFITESYDKDNNKKYFLMKETKFMLPDYTNCVLSMRIDYTDYKKQQQKIEYLSYHDNLTDLYNRTFMEEEMQRLDSSRQLPISIIMIDVNGLKLFNDTYGHQKGDQLLVKTAGIIKNSIRSEDIVARWAGDEFVILLPRTNKKNAAKIMDRIEKKCAKTEAEEIAISLAVGAAVKEEMAKNLAEVFDQADEEMYKDKMSKSSSAKKLLINNILNNLAVKSNEDSAHLERVKNTAAYFADYLNLNENDKKKLILLAEMHDIGKISVEENILKKEGELSSTEWDKVKKHSENGYKIAAASKEFASIAREIMHHHEHWDGSGYPTALTGDEIPFLSRIMALIDAYDVMRNINIYSSKMNREEAVQELKRCSGTQFDPELTEKFIEFI